MTVLAGHKASMMFVSAPCHAVSSLPFPGADKGTGDLLLCMGMTAEVTEPGPTPTQFQRESVEQIVLSICTVVGDQQNDQAMELVHPGGRVSSLCICGDIRPHQDISALIVSGSAEGTLNAFSVTVPQHSEAMSDDIVVHGHSEESVFSSALLHKGAIVAVRHMEASGQLLTAGTDGSLTVQRLDSPFPGLSPKNCDVLAPANHWSSFLDACWLGPDQLLTVATGGAVAVWDARISGKPVRKAPEDWAAAAKRATRADSTSAAGRVPLAALNTFGSVAALPSVPHACAVGHRMRAGCSPAAVLSSWDLRVMREPEVVVLGDHMHGAVGSVCVRGDPLRAGATAVPLVAATTGGQLLEVDLGAGAGVEAWGVADIQGAWVDVEADKSIGRLLVGCTDQQSLAVIDRGKGGARGGFLGSEVDVRAGISS